MGSSGQGDEIGLAAALGAIRRELAQSVAEAEEENAAVRLSVSSLELELQTTLTRDGGVDGGIRVHVISAGAKRSESHSDVQTLRIQLGAEMADGTSVRTEDTVRRPPR